ncbi:hypothetical protein EDC94DRAFT_619716 [Helicostylum pulchrum]|uniref:Uncharacterized protein n=1 Tax=Helicostylum pulchrum TaxID=562976 RepID=A0ABP9XP94_9FUNG|nr:hypothetical protein EDC94DRAFT_619716 [Helicostylum pulchrum]
MKFTSAIFTTVLVMAASVMTAPIAETGLPSASISVIDTTSPAVPNESVSPVVDTMSGAIANANITITGKDTSAQNSGSQRTMIGTAIALPVAVLAAIFLM